jgi:hypothetical protein
MILYHFFGRDRGDDIISSKKGYVQCLANFGSVLDVVFFEKISKFFEILFFRNLSKNQVRKISKNLKKNIIIS